MLTTAQRWSTIFRACRDPQHRCPRHPGSLGIGVSATRRGRRLESGGRRLTAELPRRKVVAVTDVLEGAPAGRPRANGSGRGAAAADRCLEELLGALRGARAGNLGARLDADRPGLLGEVAGAWNDLMETHQSFIGGGGAIARVVGREGRMTERLRLDDAPGAWADGVDAINSLTDDLVRPTTEVARVIVAVAVGDLSQKMALEIEGQPVKGEFLRIGTAVNTMVDQLSSFADEVTRVAREVGTEGKLGGQAEVEGVSGTWKDLTENVNQLASNLTSQVRNIAQVTTAVARGDLSQKITVDVKGEILELKDTINTMVDQLRSFADEVTRVAREVGTEGKLGGQAEVEGVSGTWKKLTDNVNFMAGNLTSQVRAIATVTTAVANGDLSKKITVDARGEILELKSTINTMVDQLGSFADEVTRVAREVGTEGKLGGQARVEGVSGTWKGLTENVNQLASNLTTQVRAIAEVSTAVTRGDLTRQISVEAQGEVAELKDNINQMIANLRETTQKNAEQDWLKTNLARIGATLQGQRDITTVSRLIMSELTPLVGAQYGAFFLADRDSGQPSLQMVASYGYTPQKKVPTRFAFGEGLVGQTAVERKTIFLAETPTRSIRIASGLGQAQPASLVVLPILFEEEVLGVIELASFDRFSENYRSFLDQLMSTIGVVINTIIANMRTEALLDQSQRLTRELQIQQEELKRSNAELEAQAKSLTESELLLHRQRQELEETNQAIEAARQSLEEKAGQLAVSSKYKSEFLANMSHELRTPLNSVLILAKLLADNSEGNLSAKQMSYARTIHTAGSDLLTFITDIAETVPATIVTDEQRVQQIIKNLLSNAFKFTHEGMVRLSVDLASAEQEYVNPSLREAEQVIRFSVSDTGIGVPPDKLRLIFEAFQQADGTTSRKYGGTGLGLSISREMARLLGGEVQVASEVGRGSTFRLFLPAHQQSADARVGLHLVPELLVGRQVDLEGAGLFGARTQLSESAESVTTTEARDDRDLLEPGDDVDLVVTEVSSLGDLVVEELHRRGRRALVASSSVGVLPLVHAFQPRAVVIALSSPGSESLTLLSRLKHDLAVRHIPTGVFTDERVRPSALAAGAALCVASAPGPREIADTLDHLRTLITRADRRVLIVDDDASVRLALGGLVGMIEGLSVVTASSWAEARSALDSGSFDCLILDLGLPDGEGLSQIEELAHQASFESLPILVYTGRELEAVEEARIRRLARSIVIKDAHSPERMMSELSLFLHLPPSALPDEQREMVAELYTSDSIVRGRQVMIIDDDVRNVFALTGALEDHGLDVVFAENGRRGIERLLEHPDVCLVLMDIMMPEMDGYETIRAIRSMPDLERLPIIALTAKAMRDDREKSIAAGASDYITKPVDVDQLLQLMRMWLHR